MGHRARAPGDIEGVLARSLEDVQQGRTSGVVPYFPFWYQNAAGQSFAGAAGVGGSGAGLFSIPGSRTSAG